MTKPKMFEKPTGVKDYLPEAVAKLRNIESKVLGCMARWGYSQIITPTLEYYDTVGTASSTSDNKLFKLLDRKGTTVVLRSDMTAPIARVVASLLKDYPFPLRLSYHSNLFRAFDEEAGREAEFFQTGVELVGDHTADADAEVIALSIACLQAAGVGRFKIALGHVGFLNGLFEEALGSDIDTQRALKQCLLNRDYVGYRTMVQGLPLEGYLKDELEGILQLRGGIEICEKARSACGDPLALESIQHLCEIWDVLQAYGVSEHVVIDLTMIGNFSYYTGMTFEGYAAELGFPVCSGGRYDNLLSQFGRPAAATGFALKTNRMMEVIGDDPLRFKKVLVLYMAEHRNEALKYAQEKRNVELTMVETRRIDSQSERSEQLNNGTYRYQGIVYDEIVSFPGEE